MDASSLPSLSRFFGTEALLGANNARVPVSEVEQKDYVMLYFSASWCPPCRQFTPQLADFYNAHKDKKKFEVVFCSWDNDQTQFSQYFSKMPWLAMTNRAHVDALGKKYGISSIPSLIVLDAKTQQVVSTQGRMAVVRDPTAEKFPWMGQDYPMVPKGLMYGAIGFIGLLLFLAFK